MTAHPHALTHAHAHRVLWTILAMLVAGELMCVFHFVSAHDVVSAVAIMLARTYDTLHNVAHKLIERWMPKPELLSEPE